MAKEFTGDEDDDIEKFHEMWRDEATPTGESGEEFSQGIQHGGNLPMLTALRDKPATDPVQWRHVKKQFGAMPYDSPRAEFLQNTHELNQSTLEYRWEGLDFEREIYWMFSGPDSHKVRAERDVSQQIRRREMCGIDYKDPVDIKITNNYLIQQCLDHIAEIDARLKNGVEVRAEWNVQMHVGSGFREKIRPMTAQTRALLERELREWQAQYRLLTEQSTSKNVNVSEVGESLADILSRTLAERGHKTQSGKSMAELRDRHRASLQLPPAEIVEAEITADNSDD